MGSAAAKPTAGRAPGCPSAVAAVARQRPSHPATSAASLRPVAPRRARAAAPRKGRKGLPHAINAAPWLHQRTMSKTGTNYKRGSPRKTKL